MRVFKPSIKMLALYFGLGLASALVTALIVFGLCTGISHGIDRGPFAMVGIPFALFLSIGAVVFFVSGWNALQTFRIDPDGITSERFGNCVTLRWRDLAECRVANSADYSQWRLRDSDGHKLDLSTNFVEQGWALAGYLSAFTEAYRRRICNVNEPREFKTGHPLILAVGCACALIFYSLIAMTFYAGIIQPDPRWPVLLVVSCLLYGGIGTATLAMAIRRYKYTLIVTDTALIEMYALHRLEIPFGEVAAFHLPAWSAIAGLPTFAGEVRARSGQKIRLQSGLSDYNFLVEELKRRIDGQLQVDGSAASEERMKTFRKKFALIYMVGGAMIAFLTLWMSTWGFKENVEQLQLYREIQSNGVSSRGIVVDSRKVGDESSGYEYAVKFRIVVDGRQYGGWNPVEQRTYIEMPIGSSATVKYLPSDPSNFRLAASIGHRAIIGNLVTKSLSAASGLILGTLLVAWSIRLRRRIDAT